MLRIGITGGIGSGKTTVSRIFEVLDIPDYYADERSKFLLQHNQNVRKKVSAVFGKEIYSPSGEPDRHMLASIVFNDEDRLRELEAIMHPAVQEDFEEWASQFTSQPYLLKEAALLYESGSYK